MKHLSRLMLLCIISVLSFSSCSKDNDEPSSTPQPKEFTASDYYMWDAYLPYENISSGTWGEGSSWHNPTTDEDASASCKYCPTYGDLLNYINAKEADQSVAVYWDNGDPGAGQQTYKADNDEGVLTEYHKGIWLKKKSAIGNAWKDNLTPDSHTNYNERVDPLPVTDAIRTSGDYFFLPAAGYYYYDDGDFRGAGTYGKYWSATPIENNRAYILSFESGKVQMSFDYRYAGNVPVAFE